MMQAKMDNIKSLRQNLVKSKSTLNLQNSMSSFQLIKKNRSNISDLLSTTFERSNSASDLNNEENSYGFSRKRRTLVSELFFKLDPLHSETLPLVMISISCTDKIKGRIEEAFNGMSTITLEEFSEFWKGISRTVATDDEFADLLIRNRRKDMGGKPRRLGRVSAAVFHESDKKLEMVTRKRRKTEALKREQDENLSRQLKMWEDNTPEKLLTITPEDEKKMQEEKAAKEAYLKLEARKRANLEYMEQIELGISTRWPEICGNYKDRAQSYSFYNTERKIKFDEVGSASSTPGPGEYNPRCEYLTRSDHIGGGARPWSAVSRMSNHQAPLPMHPGFYSAVEDSMHVSRSITYHQPTQQDADEQDAKRFAVPDLRDDGIIRKKKVKLKLRKTLSECPQFQAIAAYHGGLYSHKTKKKLKKKPAGKETRLSERERRRKSLKDEADVAETKTEKKLSRISKVVVNEEEREARSMRLDSKIEEYVTVLLQPNDSGRVECVEEAEEQPVVRRRRNSVKELYRRNSNPKHELRLQEEQESIQIHELAQLVIDDDSDDEHVDDATPESQQPALEVDCSLDSESTQDESTTTPLQAALPFTKPVRNVEKKNLPSDLYRLHKQAVGWSKYSDNRTSQSRPGTASPASASASSSSPSTPLHTTTSVQRPTTAPHSRSRRSTVSHDAKANAPSRSVLSLSLLEQRYRKNVRLDKHHSILRPKNYDVHSKNLFLSQQLTDRNKIRQNILNRGSCEVASRNVDQYFSNEELFKQIMLPKT